MKESTPMPEHVKWHLFSHHPSNLQANPAWRGINETPKTLEAVKKISEASEKYGISVLAASLRWLAYHSQLQSTDSIILGAGNWQDLEEKVGEICKGPLPDEMVVLMDEVREILGYTARQ